jgi:hypothetical protein
MIKVIEIPKVIGMTKNAAIEYLKKGGFIARIMREDEVGYVGTCDYNTGRINLELDKGKVTKADIG